MLKLVLILQLIEEQLKNTIIGDNTKIDDLVMIGHNCRVGKGCMIVSQVGIAGSCVIGDRVVIAGQASLADHISIGDDTIIALKASVTKKSFPAEINCCEDSSCSKKRIY